MRHVADAVGVSQAAVSLALRNRPGISSELRARILAAAKRLGYRVNPYLSTLMRTRRAGRPLRDRPVLALVSAFAASDGWKNGPAVTVRDMREGAIARATELGFRPQELWLHRDGMSNQRFSAMLRARGIQGFVLSPLADAALPPALEWEHFSAVGLSAPHAHLTLTTVCHDHFFASLQTVRECFRRGYRRPGHVILQSHRSRFHGRWEGGVIIAEREAGAVQPPEALVVDEWRDLAALRAWMKREKPDVIVSPGGEVIAGMLRREGCRVPEDIGVANLACPRPGHECSGVYQNGRLIGATAVETLVAMIERNEKGLPAQARTVMIEGVWNEGATLRPAPAA